MKNKDEDDFFWIETIIFVPQLSKGRRLTNLFVPKLSKERRQTKVLVPQLSKEEAKYLFLNYQRNEDEAKYLFFNYQRNEDEEKYLFLNYRWFAIAGWGFVFRAVYCRCLVFKKVGLKFDLYKKIVIRTPVTA
jgi:hypothetical protein